LHTICLTIIKRGEETTITNTHKAYDYIYKEILSNRLLPGDPVSEADLASKLGLSRTPVREALKILDTEGLVKIIPNRGTFVTEISVQDVEEIFSLRELFELHALKTSYKFIPDDTLNMLEERIKSVVKSDELEKHYEVDELFHSTIINHCGNSRLINFRNMINSQIMMMRKISSQDPNHFDISRTEHLEMIEALKARDLATAEELLSRHITSIKKRIIEVLLYKPYSMKRI